MLIPPVFTIAAERDLVVFSLKMDLAYLANQGAIPQIFKGRLL
jgi:hypothetical protein